MALTRDFRQTVRERAIRHKGYRRELLAEAVNELLAGNMEVGNAMLRDYINATITFPELGKKLNKSSKSIHRMLGPHGNPRMDSMIGILKVLQDEEQVRLRTRLQQITRDWRRQALTKVTNPRGCRFAMTTRREKAITVTRGDLNGVRGDGA